MELKDWVRAARKHKGWTLADLGEAVGRSKATAGFWEAGKTAPSYAQIKKIAEATGYPLPVEARQASQEVGNVESLDPTGAPYGVPLISWVQAGHWSQIVESFQPGAAEEWLPCPMRHGPRTYALKVRGFSMHNPAGDLSFKDGDRIFVDPDRDALHKSLVIVRLDDEKEATFKQLLIEGDVRMLQALNPSWPDRIIKINGSASLCGVVIGKVETFV
jgi:SOS-response transcriptional repressor LexA